MLFSHPWHETFFRRPCGDPLGPSRRYCWHALDRKDRCSIRVFSGSRAAGQRNSAWPSLPSRPAPCPLRFALISAMTSATTLSRFCLATFWRDRRGRSCAFTMTLRASGGAKHLSQTCRPVCFPCFSLHFWNSQVLFAIWHWLQFHQPRTFGAHSKQSLVPSCARPHAPLENPACALRWPQPEHTFVLSQVLHTR